MDMRPRYRAPNTKPMPEVVHAPPKWREQRAVSSRNVSGSSVRELRDVVEEVRHELLHERSNESAVDRLDLPTKEEIMETDTVALWSTSLVDGGEESSTTEMAAPLRDFAREATPILRNHHVYDDPTVSITAGESTYQSTVGESTYQSTVGESTFESTVGESTFQYTVGESTFQSTVDTLDTLDTSADYSCSCFSSFDEMAHDAQEIFCCGSQMAAVWVTSEAMVETAATELLHDSILKSADSFFSDDHARSIGATISEVSQELEQAGNRALDLTSLLSTNQLCVQKNAVQDEAVVATDEKQSSSNVPNEVAFRKSVLTKLKSGNNEKNKWKKKRPSQQAKKGEKKGMFGRFSGRFRKSKGRS